MDPKEYAILRIRTVRQSIQRLIIGLEYLWNKSAFGNEALDHEKVLNFCRQIKEEATAICNVCQAQPEYQSQKRVLHDGMTVSSHKKLKVG